MNESSYTRKIHGLCDRRVYTWKISDRYTAGIPDAYYSGPARDIWIEYKLIPDQQNTKLPAALSKLQQKWLRARIKEGRNVAVIVGVGSKHGIILTGASIFEPLKITEKIPCAEIAAWISDFTCDP